MASASFLRHPATWASVAAIAVPLVANYEGFFGHRYLDSVGVPTICYGATAADHVDMSRTYTKAECQEMLKNDLPKYEAQVERCIHVAMPPHRNAAILSFTYNVGGGALCKSSVARYLNAGDVRRGCDALLLYNRGGGRVISGLTNRRKSERTLCLRND